MKKLTKKYGVIESSSFHLRAIFLLVFVLANFGLYAQQDFRVRQIDTVRGDIIMVGNTILGLTDNPPNAPYNTLGTSNGGDGFNTSYIDIDLDNSTFSSSSADIIDPNEGCAEIAYAGLYWSANYYMARRGAISTTNGYGLTVNNGSFSGFYELRDSNFGNDNSTNDPVTGNLVLADDILACSGLVNSSAIAGNIAVIRRGDCTFTTKVLNAQNAGAIGVIVVNNDVGLTTMNGNASSTITIPSALIGNNDINGDDLIDLLENTTTTISATIGGQSVSNVRLTVNNTSIAGVYNVGFSSFSSDNSDVRLSPASSNLVVAQPENGCGITNSAALSGNIAIIREGGSCSNRQKVINAQNAGAIGVIIVGSSGSLPTMTGTGSTINIPSVAIGNDDVGGQDLITLVQGQSNVVNATISTSGDEQLSNLPANDPRINGTADYKDILLGFGPPGSVSYVPVSPQTGNQVINGITTHSGIIYDGYANTASNNQTVGTDNVPYTCYADVTAIVRANGFGTYTVANMKATVGETSGVSGAAGGWVLVVFYEDPTPSATNVVRFITTFDGFAGIQGGSDPSSQNLTISGFRTLPAPFPVNVRFGAAALEGDNGIVGDNLVITDVNGNPQTLFNTVNPQNNFFNSSISVNNAYYTARNPASQNTLGFDSDIFELPNDSRNLIGNDQTSANFTLETIGDTYQAFLTAFSVENIVPKIRNIKEVYSPTDLSTPINNNPVNLGDALVYRLNLKNIGNEDIDPSTNVIVEDILPANVNLTSIDGIDVTVQPSGNLNSIPSISYTTTGVGSGGVQTIIFTIPPDLLERTDAEFHIDFIVELVATCEDLRDACSDQISNIAVTTYTGEDSGIQVIDDPSSSELLACGNTDGEATNFLASVPPCEFDTPFCGGDLRLVAGSGYDEYQWSGPNGFSATTNVNFVDVPNAVGGVYTVTKIDNTPDADGNTCMTLQEQFNVTDFSATPHPLQDNAAAEDNVQYFESCNVPLAKINLCGNQSYTVDTEFDPGNLVSIVWQELTNTSCLDRDDDCPAIAGGCDANTNWTDISTTPLTTSFTVSNAGEYRIIVEFQGGCTEVFYFDVNKNDYQPAVEVVDMECGNDGSVTVNNVGSPTLRFLIRLQSDPAPTLPGDAGLFTNSTGVFTIPFQTNPYVFTVYAIDTAFPNCVYSVDGTVGSSTPTFAVSTVDPTCADNTNTNGFGSASIVVTDGLPDFEYRITGGPNNIDITSGNSDVSNGNYTFNNLEPGDYTIEVISNNPFPNCPYSENITINAAPDFVAEVVLVSPETCESGAIVQVNVISGSGGPYNYADSSGVFGTNNQFEINSPDPNTTYTFSVSDTSSTPFACIITADITGLQPYVPFTIDSVTPNSPVCPGDPGSLDVAVSSATTVAGRTFTYQLWDCANDPNCNDASLRDTSLWILLQEIGPTTNQNITFPNLGNGSTYAVSVLHNNPGDATASPICRQDSTVYAIQSNTSVTANINVTRGLSCFAGIESAQVTVNTFAGGTGNYEWSTNVNGPYTPVTLPDTVIDLTVDGNYTIFVRDPAAPDCPFFENVTIDPLVTVDDITFSVPGASNCTTNSFSITATAQPVGPTYIYNVLPEDDELSGNDNTGEYRLRRGVEYIIVATNTENGCTYSRPFQEDGLPEIRITSAVESTPVLCRGDNTGEMTFTVTNTVDFNYEIRDINNSNNVVASGTNITGTDPITFTVGSLLAGDYELYVEDNRLPSNNCTDTALVSITEPNTELEFTDVTATASNCGASTGTITVTVTGGRGNYQYRLEDSSNNPIVDYPNTNTTFTGLAPGDYTVLVRDGNDPATSCEESATVTVAQSASPTIDLATGGDACYDGTDQASQLIEIITLGVTSPVGPFEYILNRGAGAESPVAISLTTSPYTFEIPNLTDGSYTVFIRNTSTQCTSNSIPFTINPELTVTTTLDKDIDCNGDAIISFAASGGDGSYTYEIFREGTPDVSIQAGATSPYSSNLLTPGNYFVRVVDGQSCSADSNTVTVTPYPAITANATAENPACPGDNGSIIVNITGGEGPFIYDLNGTNVIGPTGDLSVTFNNIPVGNGYTVTVTDGTGVCTTTTNSVDIVAPTQITATINVIKALSCSTPTEAQVEVSNVLGGSGSYAYSIDGTNFFPFTPPLTLDYAAAGNYVIYIRNEVTQDCVVPFPVTIDPVLEVDRVDVVEGASDCNAQTTQVTLSAAPDPLPAPEVYQFEVSPDPATNVSGSSTGFSTTNNYTFAHGITYTITALRTDSNCTLSRDYNIAELDEIDITSATQAQPVTCNGGADGALTFTVTNSTSFSWVVLNSSSTPVDSGTESGTDPITVVTNATLGADTYTIEVTNIDATIDVNCTATFGPVTIIEPTPITFTADVDQTCTNNTVTVSGVSGGNGPVYEFELFDSSDVSQGAPRPITSSYTGIPNGTGYYIIVTDSKGCESPRATCDITPLPAVTLSVTSQEVCLDDNTASVEIEITNGSPDYSYSVTRNNVQIIGNTVMSAGDTTINETFTQDGTYIVTVTDSVGCTETVTIVIEPAVTISAILIKDLDCTTSPEEANIEVTVNDGYSLSYQIEVTNDGGSNWTTVSTTTPYIHTVNTSGSYQFRVTDFESCQALSNIITINPLVLPAATAAVTNVLCFGDSTGSISLTPTAGEGPFEARLLPAGVFTSNLTFSGLTGSISGTTYDFEIRDANQCIGTVSADVFENPEVTATVSNVIDIDCSTNITGTIELNPATGGSSGVTDYTYVLLNNDLTQNTTTTTNPITLIVGSGPTFDNLDEGSYFVDIIASDGCSSRIGPIAVAAPPFDLNFDMNFD